METKEEMRSRGIASPDVADAFVMAFGVLVPMSYSYMAHDDSARQEIARKYGWDYTPATPDYDDSYADRRTWNRPPPDDTSGGFGGVFTRW
jgi:hypothetical protein